MGRENGPSKGCQMSFKNRERVAKVVFVEVINGESIINPCMLLYILCAFQFAHLDLAMIATLSHTGVLFVSMVR